MVSFADKYINIKGLQIWQAEDHIQPEELLFFKKNLVVF